MGKAGWLVLIAASAMVMAAFAVPLIFSQEDSGRDTDPWARVSRPLPGTDHAALISGPLQTGPDATRACLECHRDAAREVMKTVHWTWEMHDVVLPGRTQAVDIGKKTLINNFCIGVQSNWPLCTSCHAGYGWRDDSFDFANEELVDCLVCHDQTGTYVKSGKNGGLPAESVDLTAVARSVGLPTRRNCGYCHFKGGGGDAVKHGDMDGTLYFPFERIDIHMGRHDLQCTDCHETDRHVIAGRATSVSADAANRIACTDCHSRAPHENERLNEHETSIACQTCHIPRYAIGAPTKMSWDWSTAGRDRPEDPHAYLKKKGSFTYAQDVEPEYFWYNLKTSRYLQGDEIDPNGVTHLNYPQGSIHDPEARIWPFKVHRGKQPYDVVNGYLLVPKTIGDDGYWNTFGWDQALRLGSAATGLEYSGRYGFARTDMYWSINHMVASADQALQCTDCHAEGGRMDWERLGYDGDPAYRGSPRSMSTRAEARGGR